MFGGNLDGINIVIITVVISNRLVKVRSEL